MASQIKNAALVLGTSLATLVSCPAGQQIAITDVLALNTSGAQRLVNLSIYQQSTNTVYPLSMQNRALPSAADPYKFPAKIFLTPGDELRASADAAAGVVVSVMYAASSSIVPVAKGFNPKGTYAAGTTYATNDVVDDGTNTYISLVNGNVGNTPSSSPAYWMYNARRGAVGPSMGGDVVGPSASFDGELFVASGTGGKLLKRTNIVPTTWGLARVADANQAAAQSALGLKGAAYLDTNVAGGVLTLDGSVKVPLAMLPEAVLGAMKYQSGWNANTNTPALPTPAAANRGYYYLVTTAGTTPQPGPFGNITDWQVGDWAVSDGTYWEKVDSSDQVTMVVGLQGNITQGQLKTALAYTFGDLSGTISTAMVTDNAITNIKLATMPALTIKGNNNAAVGGAADLTVLQVQSMLSIPAKGSGTDVRTFTDDAKYLTAKALADANIFVGLTDAATIAVDFNAGFNFKVTLGGSRSFGTPTNLKEGQGGVFRIKQPATGGPYTAAYPSIFKFPGATPPTHSTAANAVDRFGYLIIDGGSGLIIECTALEKDIR